MADYFVEQACRRKGVSPKTLTAAAVSVLSAMPWRGNVRELLGLMEVLVLKTDGPETGLEVVLGQAHLQDVAAPTEQRVGVIGTLREARERWEREYITAVLAQHHGRIPDAARALGIQRTNLYRKLRALHVQRLPRSGYQQARNTAQRSASKEPTTLVQGNVIGTEESPPMLGRRWSKP